jgi:hypothetical protein
MTLGRGKSYRGATRLGFSDVIVIALVAAILLFAAWKQFPAYDRPFTPLRILSPVSGLSTPEAVRTPASHTTSQP